MAADVVVDGGQLHQLAQQRDGAHGAQVLVPDHGLGDGLGLVGGPAELRADEVVGEQAAVEFEGEARRAQVGGRRADVVQEAGQGEGGGRERGGVGGELLVEDGGCWELGGGL